MVRRTGNWRAAAARWWLVGRSRHAATTGTGPAGTGPRPARRGTGRHPHRPVATGRAGIQNPGRSAAAAPAAVLVSTGAPSRRRPQPARALGSGHRLAPARSERLLLPAGDRKRGCLLLLWQRRLAAAGQVRKSPCRLPRPRPSRPGPQGAATGLARHPANLLRRRRPQGPEHCPAGRLFACAAACADRIPARRHCIARAGSTGAVTALAGRTLVVPADYSSVAWLHADTGQRQGIAAAGCGFHAYGFDRDRITILATTVMCRHFFNK